MPKNSGSTLPKEILNYRSLNSAPELLNLHVKVADEHMAMLQQQDFIGEVNSLIAALLESGKPLWKRLPKNLRSLRAN